MTSFARYARLTAIELSKMRHQRLTLTVLAIPAVVAALIPQGLWLSGAEDIEGFTAFTSSVQFGLLLGTFLIFLHASVGLVSEKSDRTLRDTLTGPVRRGEVLLSRWTAIELELLVLVTLVTSFALLSTLTHYRFEDIQGEAVLPIALAEELVHECQLAILYYLPPAMAAVSVGVLLSVIAATPVTAAAFALGSLLVLDIVKALFSSASWVQSSLFNCYLPTLFDRTSYLHVAASASKGFSDVMWEDEQHRLNLLVPLAYMLGSLLLALVLFTRKDLVE